MEGEVLQKVGMGAGVAGLQKAMQQVGHLSYHSFCSRNIYSNYYSLFFVSSAPVCNPPSPIYCLTTARATLSLAVKDRE